MLSSSLRAASTLLPEFSETAHDLRGQHSSGPAVETHRLQEAVEIRVTGQKEQQVVRPIAGAQVRKAKLALLIALVRVRSQAMDYRG
jgi:hypothetical protein